MSNKGKKPIYVSPVINFRKQGNCLIVSNSDSNKSLKVQITIPLILNLQLFKQNQKKISLVLSKKAANLNLFGTFRTQLFNMIQGLYKTHTLKFKLIGVGFKCNLKKNILILRLGFSHLLFYRLPNSVAITKIKKRPPTFSLNSINMDLIKTTAFLLRSFKKPEPYKGKGIVFLNEQIKLKEGKKTKNS